MIRNSTFATVFVTFFLLAYCIMMNVPGLLFYAEIMLLMSPLLIIWMVYTILKDNRFRHKELNGDEFGYRDKDKSELGVF